MEALPKTILVPTDFSNASRAALQQAAEVARACSAKLTVMYADTFTPPAAGDVIPAGIEGTKEAAETHLKDEVRQLVPPTVPVETMIVNDQPVHAILQIAKEKNFDWIIMGTHGRRGVDRLVLGSVTESVLRQSDRPVLTIRAAA
jgi:nucleotide-binding universal stress UspA family protein